MNLGSAPSRVQQLRDAMATRPPAPQQDRAGLLPTRPPEAPAPTAPITRTMAAVAPVAARAAVDPFRRRIESTTNAGRAAARVATSAGSSLITAGKDHAARTQAAAEQRAARGEEVTAWITGIAANRAAPLIQGGKDFIGSPQVRIGSMFAGQQVGRKMDVLAAPARTVNPVVPSYEKHFARHPEDIAKGALIGASIAIPAGVVGGTLGRGGALVAGRLAAQRTAPNVIRTGGGGGAGYATLARTSAKDILKIAGIGATFLTAAHRTRTTTGMPTGMPDWMGDWSDPHGGAGYGAPEIETPDLTDRGERYPGEGFGDYLRYRGELGRREGPVRREGPIPYYRGPEIITGGRTLRSPEIYPGKNILRSPELPTGGRTLRSPEMEGILEPWRSRPERLLPRGGPTLPGEVFAGSAITRTPSRTRRTPTRDTVDDISRYIFGYDRPTVTPTREMPDLDTWATTLSRDAARDLDLTFGSALSPPRPGVSPRFTPQFRMRSNSRPDSIPDYGIDPLSLPGSRAGAGTRTRASTVTIPSISSLVFGSTASGIATRNIPAVEYPDLTRLQNLTDHLVDYPPQFESLYSFTPAEDTRRRRRRKKEEKKHGKAATRRGSGFGFEETLSIPDLSALWRF